MNAEKTHITAEKAKYLLLNNQMLIDYHISGKLDITDFEQNNRQIHIENCIVAHFEASCVSFLAKVTLINSEFMQCSFPFTYFCGGLTIQNCIFSQYLDFQCGGHNEKDKLVEISDCLFHDFVNFYDCWYQSPIKIYRNTFLQGTNLLGNKDFPFYTSFDFEPEIANNKGQIDLDGEGGLVINTIIDIPS